MTTCTNASENLYTVIYLGTSDLYSSSTLIYTNKGTERMIV